MTAKTDMARAAIAEAREELDAMDAALRTRALHDNLTAYAAAVSGSAIVKALILYGYALAERGDDA